LGESRAEISNTAMRLPSGSKMGAVVQVRLI